MIRLGPDALPLRLARSWQPLLTPCAAIACRRTYLFFSSNTKDALSMPKISFNIPHELPAAEARERVESFLPRVKDMYKDMIKDMEEHWEGDKLAYSFKTLGFTFKGLIAMEEKKVNVDMDVPLAAMMVKGKIESEFKAGLERLLRGKAPKE
jgi:hypothetical protein